MGLIIVPTSKRCYKRLNDLTQVNNHVQCLDYKCSVNAYEGDDEDDLDDSGADGKGENRNPPVSNLEHYGSLVAN